VPISQTGLQNIPYGSLASKLNIQNLPATNFPFAADVSFDRILLPPSPNLTSANLMRVDRLETQVPQGSEKIREIDPISGSNRVRNSTCKETKCEYTVLQNIVPGSSNPLNRNLAIQVHQPGRTAWIDGGIGSIGRTLWNLKEPPGVASAFDADYFKLVLEPSPKAGTVAQKLYLAFCATVGTEWNCSSKFIGPIALPTHQVVEKNNKLTLFPMRVDLPTTGAAPSMVTPPRIIPVRQGSTLAPNAIAVTTADPVKAETLAAHQKLFGTNTLASHSILSNISNLVN
jgi:hypothetical protein